MPTMPIVSECKILKMDTIRGVAIVRYKLDKIIDPKVGDTLLHLYRVNREGYPVIIASWDITVPEDEVTLEFDRVPSGWLEKADYFTKISVGLPDEKTAEIVETPIHDARVTDSKAATCVKFDPGIKRVAVSEKATAEVIEDVIK